MKSILVTLATLRENLINIDQIMMIEIVIRVVESEWPHSTLAQSHEGMTAARRKKGGKNEVEK